MSSSLLIAKILGAAASVATCAAATAWGINATTKALSEPTIDPGNHEEDTPHSSATTIKSIIVKGVSESAGTSLSPEQMTTDSTSKNYKCQIRKDVQADPVVCKLIKLDVQSKWIDITKINDLTTEQATQPTALPVGTNYFKLLVEDPLYSSVNWTIPTSTTIDMVDADSHATKLGTLTALFKLENSTPDYANTTHLIGKSSATISSVKGSSSGDALMCTTDTNPTASTTGKACALFSFGSAAVADSDTTKKYTTQTSVSLNASSSSLTENQYYLLKYTTPTTDLLKESLTGKTSVHITASTDTNWASKGTLTDLAPVIVDGADGNAVAFILTTPQQA